jgi:hypothetical protein
MKKQFSSVEKLSRYKLRWRKKVIWGWQISWLEARRKSSRIQKMTFGSPSTCQFCGKK